MFLRFQRTRTTKITKYNLSFIQKRQVQNSQPKEKNSSDGREVRASAWGAVDLGSISSRVKPMTLKLVFTASLQAGKLLVGLLVKGTE